MKLRRAIDQHGVQSVMHWCPGCNEPHRIRIEGPEPVWTFDRNFDSPTFGPSVRCYTTNDKGHEVTICHYFIRAGRIEFCGDSVHHLAGKTIDLPEWPYAPGTFAGIHDDKGTS